MGGRALETLRGTTEPFFFTRRETLKSDETKDVNELRTVELSERKERVEVRKHV